MIVHCDVTVFYSLPKRLINVEQCIFRYVFLLKAQVRPQTLKQPLFFQTFSPLDFSWPSFEVTSNCVFKERSLSVASFDRSNMFGFSIVRLIEFCSKKKKKNSYTQLSLISDRTVKVVDVSLILHHTILLLKLPEPFFWSSDFIVFNLMQYLQLKQSQSSFNWSSNRYKYCLVTNL